MVGPDKACEAHKAALWALKVPTIIATLKTERGESLTASSSRMVLIVTMNIMNDCGIITERGKRNMVGLPGRHRQCKGRGALERREGGRAQQQQGRAQALEGRTGPHLRWTG